MQLLVEMYQDDIMGLRRALSNAKYALDDCKKRKIWASIRAEIQLSAALDPDITVKERRDINNVLNQPIL